MIPTIIKHTLEGYSDLLKNYYPAHDSTGFMETNQVFQFCKSISNVDPSAFCWLEPPLPKKGKKYPHIDAVAFLPNFETVIFIEAKRISNPHPKKREILRDTERLLKPENRSHILNNSPFVPKKQIIVILADLWLESSHKKSVPFWWTSNENPPGMNGVSSNPIDPEDTFIKKIAALDVTWRKENQHIHCFNTEKLTRESLANYCLLFGYHEVPVT